MRIVPSSDVRVNSVALRNSEPREKRRVPDNPASCAFPQVISYMLPTSHGAHKFPYAMSFRTCFSSESSATSFFSRPFSSSSCFSFRACSTFKPP